MRITALAAVGLLMALPVAVEAHGGRTNAQGCHNDRKNGGYHCHGGRRASPPPARPLSSGGAFASCAAARAAGAAPVRRGEPGYGRHLDRDNDGVGCE